MEEAIDLLRSDVDETHGLAHAALPGARVSVNWEERAAIRPWPDS